MSLLSFLGLSLLVLSILLNINLSDSSLLHVNHKISKCLLFRLPFLFFSSKHLILA